MKKTYNQMREHAAEVFHNAWISWSKHVASEENLSEVRLKRWKDTCWIPYNKLSKVEKDKDREWADQLIDSIPIKCPVWQCGGIMKVQDNHSSEDSWQTPNLVCTNCGALYHFIDFKGH